jgi:hypothetical protein
MGITLCDHQTTDRPLLATAWTLARSPRGDVRDGPADGCQEGPARAAMVQPTSLGQRPVSRTFTADEVHTDDGALPVMLQIAAVM